MKFWLPFSLLFVCISASAQDVILENNPPSLKWSQVNTRNFRIIFPNGFDSQAQRVANTLEHIREAEAKSLGSLPRKLSVILQNQSATSNGFVSVLPRRSEFYTMPSQDYNFIGTNDWLDILASHEYRHVVQYQHANRGFNRLMYYLFGAGTYAGMAQAAAPDWFWEGDAVVTETAFTRSGRGKIPNFSLLFKTNLLEGRTFNYHKQYLRSYKNNIPDHYVLGYHMVSYLRKRTNDPEIWGKISARAWSVPFIPFIFSTAIKRETGMHVTKLYREMAKDLQQQWKQQIDTLQLTSFDVLTKSRKRTYTDYQFPQALENGQVLAMKSGIGDIAKFVLLMDGQEEKVFTPGFINDSGMISAHGSWVVWNEYGFDPRFSVRTYSLIKAFNLDNNRRVVIGGKKARYGSVAISPDQTKIVAARTDQKYQTRLVILSMPDGKVIKEFPNPENAFYSMPRWSSDSRSIICLKTTREGKAIVLINTLAGSESEVTSYSNENVGYPVMHNNFVLYNSPATGIDNIFAIDLTTKKKYQVTSSRYGAYNPSVSPDGKKLYYNDQTKNGLAVVVIPFDPGQWKSYQPVPHVGGYEHLVEQEGHPDIMKTVPNDTLLVTRYSKWRGLFNPYTWGAFFNSDLTSATVGISSQDLLSTTAIDVGFVYDLVERTPSYRARVSYQGLYPIIDASATIANRSVVESFTSDDVTQEFTFDWREVNTELGLRLPLTTTSSKFVGRITTGAAMGLTRITDFTNSVNGGGRGNFYDYADNGDLVYSNLNLTASRLMKKSRRDINSPWGQYLEVINKATPFDSDFDGGLFAGTGFLFFPGIFKHHSLWMYGAYQNTKMTNAPNNYFFRNEIPVPRGLAVSRFEDFYSGSLNYTMPIWYPDIALGPLLNIQRLRANVFYDYGYGIRDVPGDEYVTRKYNSMGIEAKVDFNVLRFLPQIDMGVRFSRGLLPFETTRIELIVGTINF
jgi:hypothetical protein